ncbi:MAG: hypothetical protein J5I93_25770 [Pirellulaceae bacterium]|nr:hypothetical protein [Pirellulaceae bacterium]
MAGELYDDGDEIVVDEPEREDGLGATTEPAPASQPAPGSQPAEAAVTAELERIAARLSLIQERLNAERPVRTDEQSVAAAVAQAMAGLTGRLDALLEHVEQLDRRLEELASPSTTPAANTPPPEQDTLQQLVFGGQPSGDPALVQSRRELLNGVLRGQDKAIGLAARLMLVHAVGSEELMPLLKETGEAYYRWRPKRLDEQDPLESSLVESLGKRIAAVGLRNSIELVRPGDRYDATRHLSSDRGVEVSEVRGWAVLRDNGKPLTKALVGLR